MRQYWPLLWRAAAVGGILLVEILIRGTLLRDGRQHLDYFPLPSQLYSFLLVWAGALLILTAVEGSRQVMSVAARLAGRLPSAPWLIAHLLLIAPVVLAGRLEALTGSAPLALQQGLQHLLLAAAVLSLALAVIPAPLWRELLGGGSRRSLVALLLAALTVLAIRPVGVLWESAAAVTFWLVQLMLGPFYPDLQLIPESLSIITDTIEIHIDTTCSGLEGVALILVMCSGWLWYLRQEFRFPRALLLLPVAAVFMFLLNALRIALLTALAAQGHVEIASTGFHSQAGWIFFISASFLVALVSRRISWLRSDPAVTASVPQADPEANATAAFLVPLIAVLATGMLTRAMSAGFDPLQWLRLPIAVAVLLLYRGSYATVDWRCSWRGIVAGSVVFGAWVLAAHWLSAPAGMPPALAAQPPLQRGWWIATRALIAVLVIPIAEELAFRGFLMRRLQAAHFTAVRLQSVGLGALLLSSTLFGLSHGSYWLPGIFAGLVFGAVAMRTGRIGEAIAAHATANGLLAVLVLFFGEWQHW